MRQFFLLHNSQWQNGHYITLELPKSLCLSLDFLYLSLDMYILSSLENGKIMGTDYKFKIIVIGNAGVGKTAMVAHFAGEPVPRPYIPTKGIYFSQSAITCSKLTKVTLEQGVKYVQS